MVLRKNFNKKNMHFSKNNKYKNLRSYIINNEEKIRYNKKIQNNYENINTEKLVDIQKKLNMFSKIYIDMPCVEENGKFTLNMIKAIEKFQILNALEKTGYLDKNTIEKIDNIYMSNKDRFEKKYLINGVNYLNLSNNQLEKGDNNNYVISLQECINILANKHSNIPKLVVDGIYGINTQNAVILVEKMYDLNQDGKVNDILWKKIFDEIEN